jgi:hypothetical protein
VDGLTELHTVFDITVDSNGIGGDAWMRMRVGIAATIAGRRSDHQG